MSQSPTLAVQAHDVVKVFPKGNVVALDGVSLNVTAGTVLGLLGPNGAGKTTMVRILSTILSPDSGTAAVFGHDVKKDADTVRRMIGLAGQYATVDENLTGRENLRMVGRLTHLGGKVANQRSDELLEQFGLTDAGNRSLKTYSGGMRRRLDLAASLITRPPLIFLDEPTTGLDPRTRGQMWETIRSLVTEGCTVLLTTQYLDEADQLADRIAVIDRGRKVAEGTPGELKSSVGNSTLQLRLAPGADTEAALRIVRQVARAEPVLTAEPGGMNVPLDAADRAADVLIGLRQADVSIASVNVAQPTLDEVFFAITGHGADETGASNDNTLVEAK
jgi:ABC-2 type transport system ATP-binding protein